MVKLSGLHIDTNNPTPSDLFKGFIVAGPGFESWSGLPCEFTTLVSEVGGCPLGHRRGVHTRDLV